MLFVYNIIQFLALLLLAPILLLIVAVKAKYRLRIPKRLGFGLKRLTKKIPQGAPRIWIHALSVGEVSSSVSLIAAIKQNFPGAVILFSAATSAGEIHCRKILHHQVDFFLSFPLDLLPVARRFVKLIRPDLFILIETDFWPNFLSTLAAEDIPSLLVNGRISAKSYTKYSAFQPFFRPMFSSFSSLAMQRREDVDKMISLGVPAEKVNALGNLKYDTALPEGLRKTVVSRRHWSIPEQKIVMVAGSTHPGEEVKLCLMFNELLVEFPNFFLIIAPRFVERGNSVMKIFQQNNCPAYLRTGKFQSGANVLVLDTIGELAGLYGLADLAFVGGSLVDYAGHNPLEPAAFGTPVFFGPYMSDFADIVEDLLDEKAAVQVKDVDDLTRVVRYYLKNPGAMKKNSQAVLDFINKRQGVTSRYVKLIKQVLS